MIDPAMIALCAPTVARTTIEQVIRAESGGDPWALNINGIGRVAAKSKPEAIATAEVALAHGYTVDVGLMQVNSQHFIRYQITLSQAFDVCTNLRMGAWVLTSTYRQAVIKYGEGQVALQHALSAYNTGDLERGFANGYVARYYTRRKAPLLARAIDPK
jgi:type IV secretion system protein VirB1